MRRIQLALAKPAFVRLSDILGFDSKVLLGQTEPGLQGGVFRMDGCRALAALHLRRHAR